MREESDRDSEKRTDLRLKDGEGGALPPSAARRRRKKDNLKQASLFPSEEEQRAEINSANTSSHRNQAEQVELYIRHILLSDETLLSQKYLVYKNLTREAKHSRGGELAAQYTTETQHHRG